MGNATAPTEAPVRDKPKAKDLRRRKCMPTAVVHGANTSPAPRPIPKPWLRNTYYYAPYNFKLILKGDFLRLRWLAW